MSIRTASYVDSHLERDSRRTPLAAIQPSSTHTRDRFGGQRPHRPFLAIRTGPRHVPAGYCPGKPPHGSHAASAVRWEHHVAKARAAGEPALLAPAATAP